MRIAPEAVTALWNQLEPMVASALPNSKTHVPEDIRISLMGMQSHLFAKMNGNQVQSFIATQFCCYPQGVWLHIWLTASIPEVAFDVPAFLEVAKNWAKQHKCKGLQMINGREGWRKKFPKECFEGVVIRIDLETENGE